MNRHCRPLLCLLTVGLLVTAAAEAQPPGQYDRANSRGNQFVLRAPAGDAPAVAAQYGLTILRSVGNAGTLVLVEGDESMTPDQVVGLVAGDGRVESFEPALLGSLTPLAGSLVNPNQQVWSDLVQSDVGGTSCLTRSGVASQWNGYADQALVQQIRLADAHLLSPDCGSVTVAVIDTGVDPEHPALVGALVPGYDFLLDQAGTASEWSVLDQSVEAILEESLRAIADQSVEAILEGGGELVMLEGSMGPVLDPEMISSLGGIDLPAYFGHGTLSAGLVALVAPSAQIMPLRVFDGTGQGHLFDIVRAIYYAVDHGADVINMSFSMESSSPELDRALRYARDHGVVCVAAAGNGGAQTQVYPAAHSKVLGIASVEDDDTLSPFSNHGAALVDLGAPGAGVISTFPGGGFAAGWGTSFSAPLVAGVAALVHNLVPGDDGSAAQQRMSLVRQGADDLGLGGTIGHGRLDALGSILLAAQ